MAGFFNNLVLRLPVPADEAVEQPPGGRVAVVAGPVVGLGLALVERQGGAGGGPAQQQRPRPVAEGGLRGWLLLVGLLVLRVLHAIGCVICASRLRHFLRQARSPPFLPRQ